MKRKCSHRWQVTSRDGKGRELFPLGYANLRCSRCGHRRVQLGAGFSASAFIKGRRQRK